MAQPYSKELREQIVRSVNAGISRRTTAKLFDVSLGFVVKLMQRWSREGTLEARPTHAHTLAPHTDLVWNMVAARPRITIDELHRQLAFEGIRVSRATVWRFLNSIGLTRAKRSSIWPRAGDRAPPRHEPSATAGRLL